MKTFSKINSLSKIFLVIGLVFCFILLMPQSIAVTISLFNDEFSSINFSFINGAENYTYYLTLPKGIVEDAEMTITGYDYLYQSTLPADVMLVTDVSGSMDDDCPAGYATSGATPCKINDAKAAAHTFVNYVDTSAVHIGLVKYSTCPTINDVLQLTDNKLLLNNTINNYLATGNTNIGGGLYYAIQELVSTRKQDTDKRFIILLTDGMANYYGNAQMTRCYSGTSLGQQFARNMSILAAANNITIYGIGFGSGADMALISQIADATGGESYYAPNSTRLREIYSTIASTITQQTFPTPNVDLINPTIHSGVWYARNGYSTNTKWNGTGCTSGDVGCSDFISLLQTNLDGCSDNPCKLTFTINSMTGGIMEFSDLFINILAYGNISCTPEVQSYELRNPLNITLSDIFSINGYVGNVTELIQVSVHNVSITPFLPNYFIASPLSSLVSRTTAILRLSTDRGIISNDCSVNFDEPSGSIECSATTPSIVLHGGNSDDVDLDQIFNFSGAYGTITSFEKDSGTGITYTSHLPDYVTFTATGEISSNIVRFHVETDNGIISPSCPVRFMSIEPKCNSAQCQQYIDDKNIEALKSECIDDIIPVYNLYNSYRALDVFDDLRYLDYDVTNFYSINPLSGDFIISPQSGEKNTYFSIDGFNVAHLDEGIGVVQLDFNSYGATYCTLLRRLDYYSAIVPSDVDTDLLVSSSRSVAGYYDVNGNFISESPYIYTVKVWLRK